MRKFFLPLLITGLILQSGLAAASSRPNILLIVTDQEGSIPYGWESVLEPWYKEQLPAHQYFKENGVEFTKHKVASLCCAPSRTVLYTGQYSGVTGVTQTDGGAKRHDDPEMTWLGEYSVPTLGNWFRAAGYEEEDVAYIGKFHIANKELRDQCGEPIQTTEKNGDPILEAIKLYQDAHPLKPYGFSNAWVGPEPHGADPRNAGSQRDPGFARQIIDLLQAKAKSVEEGDQNPFFYAVDFVNPHDISLAFRHFLRRTFPKEIDLPNLPSIPLTDAMDLDQQPSIHRLSQLNLPNVVASYSIMYPLYFTSKGREKLRRFYYHLVREVDQQIYAILEALKETPMWENTYIIFTSDHGDTLGRRGFQWQKCHTLNREATDVPFYICHPSLMAGDELPMQQIKQFSSHADVAPTILSLAQVDIEETANELKNTFSTVQPLVGRDLSPALSSGRITNDTDIVYATTDDEVTRGSHPYSILGTLIFPESLWDTVPYIRYEPTEGANHLESIICNFKGFDWNFIHYFDPRGEYEDEWALYCLTLDGFEANNLVDTDPQAFEELRPELMALLEAERQKKRQDEWGNPPEPLVY